MLFRSAGVTNMQLWGKEKTERTRAPVISPHKSFLKYTANFRNIQPIFPEDCDLTLLPYKKDLSPESSSL